MIVLLAVLLLFLGAVALLFLTPERRILRAAVFLAPVAALAVVLIHLPFPDSFTIAWQPSSLFPDPLVFRSNTAAVSFSAYFCILLMLIEWTRPLQRASGIPSRVLCFLLTIAGILSFFADNALAIALVWAWIDFLSFIAILILSRTAEVGPKGITSSVSRSVSILAMNFLGNALVIFPVLQSLPSAHSDWSAAWSQPASDLAILLFLAGIAVRILVLPTQLSFSRQYTSSAGVDVLLRIISPAVVLSLLSKSWPGQLLSSNPIRTWSVAFFGIMALWAGFQWLLSPSSHERRDLFLLGVPCLAILAAFQVPQPGAILHAAGALVVLGGGVLLLYRGYFSNHRWMSIPPVILVFLLAGIPFSPAGVILSTFLSTVQPGASFVIIVMAVISEILILCAVLRLILEPVEDFSFDDSFPLYLYLLGMALASFCMLYPGWPAPQPLDPLMVILPLMLLGVSIPLFVAIGYLQRTGRDFLLFFGSSIGLNGFRSGLSFLAGKFFSLLAAVEDVFSGEGAMLWALGLSLFILLLLRGG
jgi:hypothetical protein